jgi:hypothetical protein
MTETTTINKSNDKAKSTFSVYERKYIQYHKTSIVIFHINFLFTK